MDLKQLRYFIAIAEERQITAAAKRLHMTQPPLSQQLANMEEKVGARLVHRSGNQLELTDAGKTLYNNALEIVNRAEESLLEVKEVGRGARGKLLIGTNTLSHHELPKLLLDFQEKYPKVTYKIHQNDSGQLCRLLKERTIELALVRPPIESQAFSTIPFSSEPFYFATFKEKGPQQAKISFQEMASHPLILPSTEELGLYKFILEQFTKRDLSPKVLCESSDIALLLKLVSSGFASTIIPESVLKLHREYPIKTYRIEDDSFVSSTSLIWLKGHYLSKASQNFIDLVEQLNKKA